MTMLPFALSTSPAPLTIRTLMLGTLISIALFTMVFSSTSHANKDTTDKAASVDAAAHAKTQSDKKSAPTIKEILANRQFTQGEIVRQIRTQTIDTWRYLDKYHIYIDGIGKNNNYLIQFHHSCREARSGESLLYKTHNGNLTKFDTIQIVDTLGGGHSLQPRRSCAIKEIYHLDRIENTAAKQPESSASIHPTQAIES